MDLDFFRDIASSDTLPILSAFLFGLFAMLSPCNLAINISAMGIICKNIGNKNSMGINSLNYFLGRTFIYVLFSLVIIWIWESGVEADIFGDKLAEFGHKFIPYILILMAVFMLFSNRIGHKCDNSCHHNHNNKFGAFLSGVFFGLIFCPTSSFFFFGLFVPVMLAVKYKFIMPVFFGLGTALPAIILALIFTFSVSNVDKFTERFKKIEKWSRIIIAVSLFIAALFYLFFDHHDH